MIPPDAHLYIYEIRGELGADLPSPPPSFIGLWNEEEFSYLFFTRSEDDFVNGIVGGYGLGEASCHIIKYGDWQRGLPTEGISVAGLRFVSGDRPNVLPESIQLDPSVVFGDGSHPTTVSCLRALGRIIRSHRIWSFLDLGTGSGILALAAARMGIKHILAVDRNHLAIQVVRRNVEANSLSAVIRVEEGEARLFVDRPFEVVAANLPFTVLRDLSTRVGVNSHKFWIVSGINEEQARVLKDLFMEQQYEIFHEVADPPWVTFTVVRRA
ncbi:MAG: 50S ribosomal protein L11 methyltransferase [Deltaproteobacteria bacterium]